MIRSQTANILIVEDEDSNREAILDLLESQNYQADAVSNGRYAIEKLKEQSYSLVITDLNMPEMGGEELVRNINHLEVPPVVLVQTVITDMNIVIDLMRNGVYDYIAKPYTNQEFIHRVKLAYEVAELRKVSKQVERERLERVKAQLEWNLYKEKSLKKDGDIEDSNLIESLRTSLSQASGIGSLVSLIQILKSKAKLEGNNYLVSKKLMEMIFENGDIARNIVNTLEELDYLLQTEVEFETLSTSGLGDLINESITGLSQYAAIAGHEVKFARGKLDDSTKRISINKEFFSRAVKEILTNAFKFSKPKTSVFIILEIHKDMLKLSFLSDPKEDGRGGYGIPESYQHLVFEPFFRISKHVFEEYPSHDFGIGLTFVDKVVRKHKGKVSAYMVKSHLDSGSIETSNQLVNIEIELPFN